MILEYRNYGKAGELQREKVIFIMVDSCPEV